jgi:hypothetical protein
VPQDLPKEFLERLKAITAKRAKTVIDHILKHGHITTEELKNLYGYDHPPRAARDVREKGIPLETFRVAGSQGKSIAAYRFASPSETRRGILSGRKVFSKDFKQFLIDRSGCSCAICITAYESRYLQVDHKIPYEVGGEGGGAAVPDEFQLLCGSCNRAKSWSCEHCTNWTRDRKPKVCQSCYWASPESYKHVALRAVRRLEIVWTEQEVAEFDRLAKAARKAGRAVPEYMKAALREWANRAPK